MSERNGEPVMQKEIGETNNMIRENVMDIENIVIGDENGKRKIGSMMNTKNTNRIN